MRDLSDLIGKSSKELERLLGPEERRQLESSIAEYLEFTAPSKVGIGGRFLMGFGGSPEEQRNILQRRLPEGQRAVVRDGEVGVLSKEGLSRVNPEGIDWGDVTEFVPRALLPGIPATALGALGAAAGATGGGGVGAIPGAMAGATLGATGGEAVRQGVANLLGSEGGYNPRELATEAASAGTFEPLSFLGSGVVKHLGQAFRKGARAGKAGEVEELAGKLDPSGRLTEAMPAASLSEDPRVAAIQNFVEEAPMTSRRAETMIREPFDIEKSRVIGEIKEEVGESAPRGEVAADLFQARQATKETQRGMIDDAFDELARVWPDDVPPDLSNFRSAVSEALRRRAADELEGGPGGGAALINALQEWGAFSGQVKTFKGLQGFKTRLQDAEEAGELGNLGGMMVRALMRDFESMMSLTAAKTANVGGRFGGQRIPQVFLDRGNAEVEAAFKKAMSLSKENFDIADSPTVRAMFDLREGEGIGRVVERVFARNNPAGTRRFLQSISAVEEAGFPALPEGVRLRDNISRIWLDDVVEKSLEKKKGRLSGISFLNRIFGPSGPGDETLQLMFDDGTLQRLRHFGTFVKESDVGERSFANVSQSGVRAELVSAFYKPVKYATTIAPLEATLGRVVTSKAGKRFLLEGLGDPKKSQLLTRIGTQAAVQGIQPAFSR